MAELPDSVDVVDNQLNEDGDEQTRRCWKFSPFCTRVLYWILMVRNIVGKKLRSIYHPSCDHQSSSGSLNNKDKETGYFDKFCMYYLQHERPCCIRYTNSSRRREFVYLIQHGRECCK